jgi:hypothetical protein
MLKQFETIVFLRLIRFSDVFDTLLRKIPIYIHIHPHYIFFEHLRKVPPVATFGLTLSRQGRTF